MLQRPVHLLIALTMLLLSGAGSAGAQQNRGADVSAGERADIDRINTYLNQLGRMRADFMQIAPDGSVSRGDFYLSRPGRMRFEYAPPDQILIVADGVWVAVQEDKALPIQRYPIGSTPLSPILEKQVSLGEKKEVIAVERQKGLLKLRLRDPEAPEKGELTLIFTDAGQQAGASGIELRQWVVVDAQGLMTQVGLSNIQEAERLDPKLFILNDPAPGSQHRR
jgi:outer membrane lipoprotein-sorting protein